MWLDIPKGPPEWVRGCAQTVRDHTPMRDEALANMKVAGPTARRIRINGEVFPSVREAAAETGVERWKIYNMIETGEAEYA